MVKKFLLSLSIFLLSDRAYADDSLVILCRDDVQSGSIILSNPPIVNCMDLSIAKLMFGSGIVLKPWQNFAQLQDVVRKAKDLHAYAMSYQKGKN
jgi:hypothetical protein